MRYTLELNCDSGTTRLNHSLAGMWWERVFRWITWADYDSYDEAYRTGQHMRAGSPKMCLGWNVKVTP